ncbi:MAG: helix-turn-helix transcriptional regulator [Planctomycetes bacterium]|nr:helix-turn-helix transcriptional regulator [Planctomycetota bacterium]
MKKYPWQIIESLRAQRKISKKKLAKKLGINYSYMVDLLNGRYPSKIATRKLQIVSEVLDVPMVDLLSELSGTRKKSKEKSGYKLTPPSGVTGPKKHTSTLPESELSIQEAGQTWGQARDDRSTIGLTRQPTSPVTPDSGLQLPVIPHAQGQGINLPPEAGEAVGTLIGYRLGLTSTEPDTPQFLDQKEIQWIPAPPGFSDQKGLALSITNDSLFPPFSPGSIFVISPGQKARPGDIVLAMTRDYRAWIMELQKMDADSIVLRPYHPERESILIEQRDIILIYPVVWVKMG